MPETSMGIRYPASTDDVQLWTKFQNMATDINTLLELPSRQEAFVANTIAITATSFAALPSPGPCQIAFTNPSADYDLEVDVTFSAWIATGGANNVTVGVAASGGMTWTANGFGSGGPSANSDNLFTSATSTGQQKSGYPVTIPAGAAAVTFAMQAFRGNTAGSPACNYPALRVIPRRFIVP